MRNVMYGIICSSCKSTVYVGETEWELGERMTEHLRDGHLNKDKPISAHFGKKEHGHDVVGFCGDGKSIWSRVHRKTTDTGTQTRHCFKIRKQNM